MANVPRVVGANLRFYAQFQTAYGTQATGNYFEAAAYELPNFRGEQNLNTRPLLGAGREPQDPTYGAFNLEDTLVVPVDVRNMGSWLKALLGPAQAPATVGARGFIEFDENPAPNETIGLNGDTWTFVASGATGNQTNIGVSLIATLDQAVIDLNASADAQISVATYSRIGNRLVIQHDTGDATGNTYAISKGTAASRVSKATLYGGGLIKHEFRSGATALPALTMQLYHADYSGTNKYTVAPDIVFNTMVLRQERETPPDATIGIRGRNSIRQSTSAAGTPTVPVVSLFSSFQGQLLVNDILPANIVSAEINYDNGLLVADNLTPDGLIEGVDPGGITLGMNIVARLSANELETASDANAAISLRLGWLNITTGHELSFYMERITLPKPTGRFDGPGYSELTYAGIGSKGTTRSMTVTLHNDVATYE